MAIFLKQSTAATVKIGPFVDSGDGVTVEDGLTIGQADIRLSKNGGAFAQTNNNTGATHDENGYYGVPLDTTDTGTLGWLRVAVNESGALPVWQDFMVVPANVWDSFFGADKLQVDTVEISGTTQTANDVGADVNEILTDTGTTLQAELDGIQADTEDIQSKIGSPAGASVSADIAAVKAETASILTDTAEIGAAGAGLTDLGGMSTGMKAEVNAEVLDVVNTDTFGEPTGVPGATISLREKIGWLFMALRNKVTVTSSKMTFYDDGDAAEWEKDLSDDGTTYTESEGNAV